MIRVETPTTSLGSSSPADHRAAILAIILVSYVMIVLDTSIVITGLPKIHRELGFSDAGLSWVTNAYTLTFGGFLLLGARAGDVFGRRRVYIAGLVIFALSSIVIGLAQSPAELVVARCVQGLGSAILAPSTLALLQANFPAGPERSRAVSYYASAAGISASVGLVLGGVLAEWLSWRVGFFINLPISAMLALATRRYVAETNRQPGRFDLLGALTSTLGMSALVFGTVNSATAGWNDSLTLASLGLVPGADRALPHPRQHHRTGAGSVFGRGLAPGRPQSLQGAADQRHLRDGLLIDRVTRAGGERGDHDVPDDHCPGTGPDPGAQPDRGDRAGHVGRSSRLPVAAAYPGNRTDQRSDNPS